MTYVVSGFSPVKTPEVCQCSPSMENSTPRSVLTVMLSAVTAVTLGIAGADWEPLTIS